MLALLSVSLLLTPFCAKAATSITLAWNPSITGVKSEDTVLVKSGATEILTAHSNDWPTVTGHFAGQTMRRADGCSDSQ